MRTQQWLSWRCGREKRCCGGTGGEAGHGARVVCVCVSKEEQGEAERGTSRAAAAFM
jgi:hypothetical protein